MAFNPGANPFADSSAFFGSFVEAPFEPFGYGLLFIDEKLDDLVIENVREITVRGKILCSDRIKEHFGLK